VSDYLAVGGVSAVLCSLLSTALSSGGPTTILGPTPGITAISPDLITTGPNEQPQLNLFMYYISVNPALRNLGLPSSNAQGGRLSNPPLALDLHYLVTAYGSAQFAPEILLAWAMKVFHDTPVVPSQAIQSALDGLAAQHQPTTEASLISGSTLAEQIEHLRITPEVLSTEEIYRLWTAFQAAYRPTTALQVSVVVIQDTQPFTSNLPVQARAVTALPLQAPVITGLSPLMIAAGQVLTITGSNFLGSSPADTVVSFDGGAAGPADTVQGNLIRITLPADLAAGTRTVRVQRMVTFPPSAVAHQGFSSSPAPFQLVPVIKTPVPQATPGSPLTLTISPAVGQAQQATLYIGDSALPAGPRPVTGPASSTTISVPIPADFPAGTYPVRIEIDGAQSLLTAAAGGQFTPQVQVGT
jgi:Pvc16 N-terminal domain/IPT/TIG domain